MNSVVREKRQQSSLNRRPKPRRVKLSVQDRLPISFLLSAVILLILWGLVVEIFKVPTYILPTPVDTLIALWNGVVTDPTSQQSLLYQTAMTLKGMLLGYFIGLVLGMLVAIMMSESRAFERIALPYAVGFQSLPTIAIAPLVVIWFGPGFNSLVILTAVVAFFPIMMNTFHGLHSADADQIRLMQAIKASRIQTLRWVRLPGAMRMIFAGLDVAVVYGLIGAIVAEFVSGTVGIGVTIIQYQYSNDTAAVFAALFVLACAGLLMHFCVVKLRDKVINWEADDARRPGTPKK